MSDSVRVLGLTISPTTDIHALLREEFLGAARFSGRYDEDPLPGVRSFLDSALKTDIRTRTRDALLRLLTDRDPKVRSGAVQVVLHFAEAFDAKTLLDILEDNRSLFENVPETYQSNREALDLRWSLLRAISANRTDNPIVLRTLRRALAEKNGGWILAGLVSSDPEWIADHPQEVLNNDPTRARVVLYRLPSADLRQRFVRAIPRESPSLRNDVAAAVTSEIRDTTERRRLLEYLDK